MAPLDEAIDRLYQGPLGTFTQSRNRLAKTAGTRAGEVKALQKPTAAAWAVNQLYWRRRRLFDRLVRAAARVRAAHVQRIDGRATDLRSRETEHRAATEAALAEAKSLLETAADPAREATIAAVRRTLEALPDPAFQGRLLRPLDPSGFGMLAALLLSGGPAVRPRKAEVIPIAAGRSKVHAQRTLRERTDALARKAEADRLRRDVRTAKAAERRLHAEARRAQQAYDTARQTAAALGAQAQAAAAQAQTRRAVAEQAQARARAATAARAEAERHLDVVPD